MEGDGNGEALVKAISDSILRALPGIVTTETARSIAQHLSNSGLKTQDQLMFVQEADLVDHLTRFEARQLIVAWKGGEGSGSNRNNLNDNNKENRPIVDHERAVRTDWDFKINWKDIYAVHKTMKSKLKGGKKLRRKEKKEIVGRVVQQVRDNVPHAERTIFDQIAGDMKRKYPVTFSSELAKGKLGRKTLGYKMKTKFDNDKRPASRKTATEKEAPSVKAAYGCLKWRVVLRPAGETEESLEKRRLNLEEHFESLRPSAWDWELINSEMNLTFGQQRAEINKQAEEILKAQKALRQKKQTDAETNQPPEVTTTVSIRNRWPFLFVPSGMFIHYTTLTEINLEEKFELFLDSPIQKMIEFLSATNKEKKKKSILRKMKEAEETLGAESNVPAFGGCLLLLLQRFEEKKDALWRLIDTHESEIPQRVELPKTPCLIIKGSTIFTEDDLYFTMDGHLLGTATGLIEGIAMLFASYFVFNLDYAAEAQITLEFIQRIIAELNPSRGNKRPKRAAGGKASSRSVHHVLAQMNEKYDEYFAENSDSEESDNVDDDLEEED